MKRSILFLYLLLPLFVNAAEYTGRLQGDGSALTRIPQLASTQTFSGANTFRSTAAFTAQNASLPGVMISSGLVVSAGSVGIGTLNPLDTLHVIGNIRSGVEYYGYAGQSGNDLVIASNGDQNYRLNVPPINSGTGNIVFKTAAYTAGDTERMRVRYDGNVGIGTASPTSRFTSYYGDAIDPSLTWDSFAPVNFKAEGATRDGQHISRPRPVDEWQRGFLSHVGGCPAVG
ncbi:MAG: hypothetical protein NTY45_08330 [Elusimicrobia bacterium]|nr:hypothetical protein [Elusimicrobiota bacterium]